MNTLVIVSDRSCLSGCWLYVYMAAGWPTNGASTRRQRHRLSAKEDGQDYVPTDGWTVFAHQFSSIAGAGPVTGAIQAAVIRLGSGTSLDPHRRYLLRCRYRLWCTVCQCQE